MKRKKLMPAVYVSAFSVTALIFIAGILVGNYFSGLKVSSIDQLESEIKAEALGTDLQYQILSEHPCEFMNMSVYTTQLSEMGKKLTFMEEQLGRKNSKVLSLKEQYHLLEIQHWLYSKRWIEECGGDKELVLFFYTNPEECSDCEDQGYVLNYVHSKYPSFNIYSFEYAIENPALDTLKELYNLEKNRLPTVVIGETVYYGFQSKDQLMQILGLGDEEQN
ncbi:MAG: hypothetical protein V1659_04870 [Candidatus Woesearchaeota archaeon]